MITFYKIDEKEILNSQIVPQTPPKPTEVVVIVTKTGVSGSIEFKTIQDGQSLFRV